jgi:hypothetical protein
MDIHIITVTLAGAGLLCEPEECEITADSHMTLVVWQLGDGLEDATFVELKNSNPGLEIIGKKPYKRFQRRNIDRPKKHASIMNRFHPGDDQGRWSYKLRVRTPAGPFETGTNGTGKTKDPVIINR